MSADLLNDTRDLVVRLDERFKDIEKRVAKNSAILDELHDYVTQARGAHRVGRALWEAAKLVGAGVTSVGLWPHLQALFPKA